MGFKSNGINDFDTTMFNIYNVCKRFNLNNQKDVNNYTIANSRITETILKLKYPELTRIKNLFNEEATSKCLDEYLSILKISPFINNIKTNLIDIEVVEFTRKINEMKKLLMTVMALSCFAFSSYGQKKVEKQIIGKWCNPYTYQSTGELKGFEFKKGGKCSAVNIPSLDLKTWKIDKDGYLIVEGFSKGEDGKVEVYKTRERIGYITPDSLELVAQDGPPRLAFLYLNTKSIKKLVTSEVAPDKK